jgi:PhzF family phenazine biosynthesis protein
MTTYVHLVSVFTAGAGGGNPAPIVVDAAGMSDTDMQRVAQAYGHESGFVLPPPAGSGCDFAFRFWVPNHEMEMCGHATVGAVWLLDQLGGLPGDRVSISTRSGRVDAHIVGRGTAEARVEITQPRGRVEVIPDPVPMQAEILSVLGLTPDELAPFPIQHAWTSRVKTLVPLRSVTVLDGLRPDFHRMEPLCERIGSTGLYPYATAELGARLFDARQFPKSSGYPEDAATGIAAAALAFGLLENRLIGADNQPIHIRQGRAMGRPSEIAVRLRLDEAGQVDGCWIGGQVRLEDVAEITVKG